jgi:hypothetical protein
VLVVVLLIVLSVLFGGFQKGTKESGLGAELRAGVALGSPVGLVVQVGGSYGATAPRLIRTYAE